MNTGDHRTVGDLLLDSEFLARDALMNPDELEAGAMVRTWGEVVESAADLWDALPYVDPAAVQAGARRGRATMERLQSLNTSFMKSTRGQVWPGDGPAEPRLLAISENLTRAAELVNKYGTDTNLIHAPVQADLAAAKARLMHTLYIGAHGVHVAVGRDLRALQDSQASNPTGTPSLKPLRAARDRVAAFEAVAGSYVSRSYPAALDGEHQATPELSRVSDALASWEIHGQRTLATTPTSGNLMAITQTHAWVLMATQRLLHAAAETGAIDKDQFVERLSPALEDAQTSWGDLATTWQKLTPPSAQRIAPGLVTAAHEARAALLELVHDRTGPASATTIATRVDLEEVAHTLQQTISASVELAHRVLEGGGDSALTVGARAASTMSMELDALRPLNSVGEIAAAVDANDVQSNRQIPLPDQIRDSLEQLSLKVVETSTIASSVSTLLDHRVPNRSAERLPGRAQAERSPMSLSASYAWGCER